MNTSRININPIACCIVTNAFKGTQKLDYFNSEILSKKNQAVGMDHCDKLQGMRQRLEY